MIRLRESIACSWFLKGKRLAAGTGTGLLNDTLKEVFK